MDGEPFYLGGPCVLEMEPRNQVKGGEGGEGEERGEKEKKTGNYK